RVQPEVVEQHAGREDGGQRVGDALAGDVGGGAVDRFEHAGVGPLRVDVGAGGHAHAAGDDGAQVGEDVAEEVAGDDDVEDLRLADEVHGGGVDEEASGR